MIATEKSVNDMKRSDQIRSPGAHLVDQIDDYNTIDQIAARLGARVYDSHNIRD